MFLVKKYIAFVLFTLTTNRGDDSSNSTEMYFKMADIELITHICGWA